jgi:hypothetical protein
MKGQGETETAPAASEPAKDGLTGTISTKRGEGSQAERDSGKKKVGFTNEKPELSPEESKAIKDFSNAFGLKEDRMGKIFKDSKTPDGIKDVDNAYLIHKGEENPKFKESSFFKGLFSENDIKKGGGGPQVQGVLGGNDSDDERRRRSANIGEGKGGEGKGGNNKLMLALGLLFIACIFLATGGAALPLIGGAIAASQGLFIAGAVGAGLVGAGLFIKDQIGQGNNKVGVEMSEGPGLKLKSNQGTQGQAQGQEKAQAPEKAPGQGQEKAQAPAPAQGQEKAQAPAQAQRQEKAPASIPDLMELMKKDLKTQIENEKDILRDFKNALDNNPKLRDANDRISNVANSLPYESTLRSKEDLDKLSALPNDTKDKLSKVGEVKPGEVTKKLPQAEPENIRRDSKSQSQAIQALNLEMPKTRPDPSSQSWAQRMTEAKGSKGISGSGSRG